jgi:hypothetical protein
LPLLAGKWYALLGPGSNASEVDEGVSLNTWLVQLPLDDVGAFLGNLKRVG